MHFVVRVFCGFPCTIEGCVPPGVRHLPALKELSLWGNELSGEMKSRASVGCQGFRNKRVRVWYFQSLQGRQSLRRS